MEQTIRKENRRKAVYMCSLSLVNVTQLKIVHILFCFFQYECFGKVRKKEKKKEPPSVFCGMCGLTVLSLTLKWRGGNLVL